ncbi:MAG: M48 family metallopeptidase, partial [candidate division Zixibacteria bacterium]|nr:M48 family metallopeptidase [candidate division Zixibacteria bacterium]
MNSTPSVVVKRWSSESIWLALVILTSIALWILLFLSAIGIFYAILFGVFFFLTHLAFIAHIRGSAVKISSEQFPEIYSTVNELSMKIGLEPVPEAYLMQQGGALNALAIKLFRSNIIVLYTDLLEACGDNTTARNMIIGHELGHIKEGHLRLHWLLLPGLMIPFLGTALYRAREFTCDRYGYILAGTGEAALRGLAILSAGSVYGPQINLEKFVCQRESLNTGTMTIGKWMSTHPPLSERIAALQYSLVSNLKPQWRGNARAIGMLALSFMITTGITVGAMTFFAKVMEKVKEIQSETVSATASEALVNQIGIDSAKVLVSSDLSLLAEVVEEVKLSTG